MNSFNIDDCLKATYAHYPQVTDRPVIGLSGNAAGEDFFLRQTYVRQIERGGGVPVILAPVTTDDPQLNIQIISQQLDTIDAVLFTGGGDINPLWQNEEPHTKLGSINPVRDTHELLMCRLAYNRQLPILGICRGIQTIATALGGHVAQDISSFASIKHSQDAPKPEPTHSIRIDKDTILYNIYKEHFAHEKDGKGIIFVNSFHHQSVDKPGRMLRISATATDGVIEAIESVEHKSILGVQWHPEALGDDGLPLFRWLCDEAQLFRNAKALHKDILTLDSHCDTPMFFPQNVNFLSRDSRILYDLQKMDEGHIDAVNMVCYLPQPKIGEKFSDKVSAIDDKGNPITIKSPAEYVDLVFDKIEAICDKQPSRLSIARNPNELYRDKRQGRHSIMLGIENGLALEHDLSKLEYYQQRGITYITLCHNGDNDICDSAKGCQTHGGLSSFGKKVVAEMNRLGIMIDMSHAAESSFYDVIALSQKPIVCSHSNCRALCDHPRNITDNQMRELAKKGGVMQLTMYPGFLRTSGEASIEDFIRHLEHAIDIMGIDYVGIGTDFDGDGGIIGLANAAELINLTMHLLRRGYTRRDIEKIWGKNWLRVMALVKAPQEV